MEKPLIGTCSWNYDSWVGLVYTHPCRTAAEYLVEYSRKYRSAEVDSWFYKMPSAREVSDYRAAVDADFRFTCKAPRELCQALLPGTPPKRNPGFLSAPLYEEFLRSLEALGGMVEAIILEFEYMNRAKMGGVQEFLEALGPFVRDISRDIPLAIECRNGNYLDRSYFGFLQEHGIAHVFSEKQYMPPIASVYGEFGDLLSGTSLIRLLGGDRKEIEAATGERWDRLVSPKPEKPQIAKMVKNLLVQGKRVVVNVNNHYEGSAPLTIESLLESLAEA
jgi:uncharacterized protein YecE (DUF72 family)